MYVNATRATIVALFGNEGVQLQGQLAAWWMEEMRSVADGKLPDFIVQEMKRARNVDTDKSLRAVPPQNSGPSRHGDVAKAA